MTQNSKTGGSIPPVRSSNTAMPAAARSQRPVDTSIGGKTQPGFAVAPEVKLSRMNGEFAALAACSDGCVITPGFLIGAGGYGKTTDIFTHGYMGYGGVVLQSAEIPWFGVEFFERE